MKSVFFFSPQESLSFVPNYGALHAMLNYQLISCLQQILIVTKCFGYITASVAYTNYMLHFPTYRTQPLPHSLFHYKAVVRDPFSIKTTKQKMYYLYLYQSKITVHMNLVKHGYWHIFAINNLRSSLVGTWTIR